MPHTQTPLILIVDDEPSVRQFLTDLLQEFGYAVITAGNGREGLTVARRELPDLIISDRSMPDMDGLAFLWALRDDTSIRHIPFIFASGGYDQFLVEEARRHGAAACLPKPFRIRDLHQAVRQALEQADATVTAG